MQTAQAADSRVEDLSQRGPSTRVYANPDGSWTAEETSQPEFVQDLATGEWTPIDTALVEVEGGFAPANAASDVVFSDGGDRLFAELSEAGKDLGWKWIGVLPAPMIEGSTATYPNVVENGDLVVTALPAGFSYNIVLREAPTQPLVLTMPVATDGAVVTENAQGGLEVETKSGETLAEAPRPIMWDSSADAAGDPEVERVDTMVTKTSGGNAAITLAPDQGFLTDPATVYPVVVDPSFTSIADADTWVQNAEFTNSMSGSDELRAGTYDSGTHRARSFLKFNDTRWDGKKVTSATFRLRNWLSLSCGGSPIRVSRITQSWTQSSLTWGNQPSVTSTNSDTLNAAYGGPNGSSCEAGADADWNVTAIVDSWASGANPNYGLRVAADNDTQNASWRRYRSLEQTTTNGTGILPRLIVTYNSYPNTAWRPQVITDPPSNPGYSRSKTPLVQATVTDPDGGNVKARFSFTGGSTWTGDASSWVTSGSMSKLQMTSGLAEGASYTLTARALDPGGLLSKNVSASATFIVDSIAPATTITATGFVDGTWTATQPGSNTFTLNGPTDTDYFTVTKDGIPDGTLDADAAGDATLAWNPANGGHTLAVTAFDKAGNSASASFKFGVGGAALAVSPADDQASTGVFAASGTAPAGASGARMEYRIPDAATTTWTAAPMSSVKTAAGSSWNGAVTQANGGSVTGNLAFNVRSAGSFSGSLTAEVRVCFTYTVGADNCSNARRVQLVESAFGGRFPTGQAGPASVALFTGEAMIAAPDALDASAGAGRVFSSFDGSTMVDGPFGPGWSSMIAADSEVSGATIIDNTEPGDVNTQKRFVLQIDGWGEQTYKQQTTTTTFVPEGTDDGSRLTLNTAGDRLTFTPLIGGTTVWAKTTDGWELVTADPIGSGVTNVVTSGTTKFIAQIAPGTSASCTLTTQTDGCRGLKITQSNGHIDMITQVVAGEADQDLASYTYSSGKLSKVCDLTQGTTWCVDYTYTTVNGRTLLASAAPPGGVKPWAFTYDTTGRLTKVTRALDAATGTGDATWSVKYDLDPATSGLPAITAASAAEWGQTEIPVKAAAVWQPNRVPASTPTAGDLAYAAVSWMTADGKTTNTAVNSGSQWLVDTQWFDTRDNVVRSLDGAGWARVQAAVAADRVGVADQASSYSVYNADGARVEDEYGPVHTATLKNGTTGPYRAHTAYVYDDEAATADVPGRPALPTGQTSWGLVVNTISSVANPDRTGAFDATTVKNTYAPIVSGDTSGWDLGQPTKTEVQQSGGAWNTVNISRYNADGQVIETRQPGGATNSTGEGTDAHSTMFVYYTAAANSAYPECGSKPDWAGLECMHGPAGQPAGNPMPRTFTTTYNRDLVPLVTEDRSGGTVRTTTTTLDSKGRTSTVATSITGGNTSDPTLPNVTYAYDNTTGALTSVTAGGETISATYDTWGRLKTYTDASGMTSTTTYGSAGETATFNDGVGVYTYTYGDNRGLPTSIDVGLATGPDVFTIAYGNDGQPSTVTYPNGTVATYGYDEIGFRQSLTYKNGTTDLAGFTNTTDVDGRVIAATSSASSQDYTFDALGRLTKTEDTRSDGCTTRTYGFSTASERTNKTTYAPNSTGGCQTTTPTTTWNGTYDTANRITNTGYTYDNLGRTRTTPAADTAAGAMGALTTTYYPNDMVASLTQPVDNGAGTAVTKTNTYSLDPAGRIDTITTTTAGTETQRLQYRFSAAGDAPTSIATSINAGANWTTNRYIQVPSMGMVGNATGTTAEWSLANLHGDTVATQTTATGNTTLASYSETDEYGAPVVGTTPGRYGYLGTHQRSSDGPGGLTLMGARLYNPLTGLFSSFDSVIGGNATRSGYPEDPVNMTDLTGRVSTGTRGVYDGCRDGGGGRLKCVRVVAMSAKLFVIIKEMKGLLGWKNGAANAIRHFVWSVLLMWRYGQSIAIATANGHEEYSKSELDSWVDQHNNFLGREYARNHSRPDNYKSDKAISRLISIAQTMWYQDRLASGSNGCFRMGDEPCLYE